MGSRTVATELEDLQERAHQSLVAFLGVEVDVGFTFVRTAEIESAMNNHEHFELARKNVELALGTIQRFNDRIVDFRVRRKIQESALELGKCLCSLEARMRALSPCERC